MSSQQSNNGSNNPASGSAATEKQDQRELYVFFARLSEQSERFDGNFFRTNLIISFRDG
jgi:hypothetical protein